MNHARHGIKILGLSLLATLSLMAAFAAGAQAELEWQIGGKSASETPILGTIGETFTLAIPWYETEIDCKALAIENGKILSAGGSNGTIKLSTCEVLGPPFVSKTCKLIEPIELKVKDTLVELGGKIYDLFQSQEAGKAFATIQFKEGTECPIPLKNELTGAFVGSTESGERIKQPFTFSAAVEKEFPGDTISFGTHPATLKGKALLDLGAGFEGQEWGAAVKKKRTSSDSER